MLKHYKYPFAIIATLASVGLFFLILSIPNGTLLSQQNKRSELTSNNNALTIKSLNDNNGQIKLLFVGDIMLARNVGYYVNIGEDPFKHVKDHFAKYDIVVGNLETTIAKSSTGVQASKGYSFKAPVSAVNVLSKAGIQVVSLANNHTMDYGEDALLETITNLNSAGIGSIGAGKTESDAYKPFYIQFKDTKIAIIALNDVERWITDVNQYHAGNAYLDENKVMLLLRDAVDNSDIQIVFPHWGEEYVTRSNAGQQKWARFFIDNGADLVVGSHPHVIQDSEIYKDKYIYYSLGNFVFDGMKGIYLADKGAMLEVSISNKSIAGHKEYFVELGWDGFPKLSN